MVKEKLTAKPKLGFLGTGLMGSPMILRLLDAGYSIYIWNRTAEKITSLLELSDVAPDEEEPTSRQVQDGSTIRVALAKLSHGQVTANNV